MLPFKSQEIERSRGGGNVRYLWIPAMGYRG